MYNSRSGVNNSDPLTSANGREYHANLEEIRGYLKNKKHWPQRCDIKDAQAAISARGRYTHFIFICSGGTYSQHCVMSVRNTGSKHRARRSAPQSRVVLPTLCRLTYPCLLTWCMQTLRMTLRANPIWIHSQVPPLYRPKCMFYYLYHYLSMYNFTLNAML